MEQPKSGGDGREFRPWPGTRALTHPVTLMAISLLLLNDHVLKRLVPSALTGKLSDFAGLLFFPMLALELSGRVLGPRCSKRRAGVAFAATGGGFAVLKLIGPVNAAVRDLAEQLVGMRLQLALDASDLWALAVLPAGYALWLHAESRPARWPRRFQMLVLSVGTLAALATSPCPPEQPINRLLAGADGVHAVSQVLDPSTVYRSLDAGRSWEYLQADDVPAEIRGREDQPIAFPIVVCLPDDPKQCFRIDGNRPIVELSVDAGQTWQTVWSPPAARLSYMQRVASGSGQLLACGKEIDFTPHDMILLEEGGQTIVLVAIGNEGVLRHPTDGETWQRTGVGWAKATPERASSLHDLWLPSPILTETLVLLASAAIAFWVLSSRAWRLVDRRPDAPGNGYSGFWWVAGALFALTVGVALWLGAEELLIPIGIPLGFLLAMGAFLGQRWAIAIADSAQPAATRRALWISLLATFGCAALGWLVFALWMFGAIPAYTLAFLAAAVVVVAGWLGGWREIRRNILPAPSTA